jgi:hypothetical protein
MLYRNKQLTINYFTANSELFINLAKRSHVSNNSY